MTKNPETPTEERPWKENVITFAGILKEAVLKKLTAPRPKGPLPYAVAVFVVLAGLVCLFYGDVLTEPFRKSLATVNGQKITQRAFTKAFSRHMEVIGRSSNFDEDELEGLKREILDDLITRRIMLQQARKLNITVSDRELADRIEEIKKDYASSEGFYGAFRDGKVDYASWAEELKKRLILEKLIQAEVNDRVVVSVDEARGYYAANRRRYVSEERIRLAQIILAEEAEGEKAALRLKAGEDFDKVAREVSIGPEREHGGDLGYFTRGMLPEAIEKAVFSLPVGQPSKLTQSPYGFHIFRVSKKERKGAGRFEDLEDRVKADLKKEKEEEAFMAWVETLKAASVIEIDGDTLRQIRLE
ncbi:MAG TPA: SurA N-terminal domain-containing protein [Syntrophales bacterium]|nr:SurA N-terminal domain-containing protein [Syntrophales bacterium]HOX94723.1 SurA N-terminal domain-containing protein [Syntrophales bacterium]HPI57163.1 SurA N-terminal domain-containing protein [Syntrophales bacterium]HPN24750.1 SurA N-terminal domain-containing protein [Syntrophales bacterium]HQM29880.1 SurA N-terminal domain-containing protein [Syntrophales bacterium]